MDDLPEITEHVIVMNHRFIDVFRSWLAGEELVRPAVPGVPGLMEEERFFGSRLKKPVRLLDDGTVSNETRLGAVKDIQFALQQVGNTEDWLVLAGDNFGWMCRLSG